MWTVNWDSSVSTMEFNDHVVNTQKRKKKSEEKNLV